MTMRLGSGPHNEIGTFWYSGRMIACLS